MLSKLRKKSPKVTAGFTNPAAFDSASNASTSDDEQLKEQKPKPKTKMSLKKKLSLGKTREQVPREFENPAYGSFFEIRSDEIHVPSINVVNGDDDVDYNNVAVTNGRYV